MKDIENAIAAAQVLSFRLPMLWAMACSPTPARRAEAMKMIVEKQMAVIEGMNALRREWCLNPPAMPGWTGWARSAR